MGENPFQDQADDIEIPEFDEPPKQTKIDTQNSMKSNQFSSSSKQTNEINNNSTFSTPKQYTGDKRAKLEALKQREAELLEKKKKIEQATSELTPQPNFPPFFPLIRYNPEEDLPPASHECVSAGMKMLLFLTAASCFNILAILCVSGLRNYQKVRSFIFGCIQGFTAVYLGLNFSYNLLYKSCRKRDIPFKWTIYQFLLVAWCIYITLGFPTSGSVGIATMLDILANSAPFYSTLFAIINTILSGAATAFAMLTLSKAQAYQKVSGKEDPLLNERAV